MHAILWEYPVHFLAYGFGSGLVPFAPGTFGSTIGMALFWIMARLKAGVYAGITLGLFLLGILICGQTARDTGAIDPGSIVYDEIIGFLVAMFLIPRNWRWISAGFVIYRLFDIWKPYPIHLVEEFTGLGTSIMADDVVAGLYTLLLLHTVRWLIEGSNTTKNG